MASLTSNLWESDYLEVMSQAVSHGTPSTSIRMRINSGMQRVGWVSFIWIATFVGKLFQFSLVPDHSLKRAIMSWMDAEQRVYCCFKRSNFPCVDASPGYNT